MTTYYCTFSVYAKVGQYEQTVKVDIWFDETRYRVDATSTLEDHWFHHTDRATGSVAGEHPNPMEASMVFWKWKVMAAMARTHAWCNAATDEAQVERLLRKARVVRRRADLAAAAD